MTENDNYLFENIKTTLYESDNPLLFVLTVPKNMTTKAIEVVHEKFEDFKKKSNIDIPFIILIEGMTLSLIERPK